MSMDTDSDSLEFILDTWSAPNQEHYDEMIASFWRGCDDNEADSWFNEPCIEDYVPEDYVPQTPPRLVRRPPFQLTIPESPYNFSPLPPSFSPYSLPHVSDTSEESRCVTPSIDPDRRLALSAVFTNSSDSTLSIISTGSNSTYETDTEPVMGAFRFSFNSPRLVRRRLNFD